MTTSATTTRQPGLRFRSGLRPLRLSTPLVIAAILAATSLRAETLDTPSFTIEIEVRCEEGNVTCDNVTYVGTSKKTGKSVSLLGKTMHSTCADGITPCHFQGYEFRNGATTYTVMADGTLIVMRGSKILVQERGEWIQ